VVVVGALLGLLILRSGGDGGPRADRTRAAPRAADATRAGDDRSAGSAGSGAAPAATPTPSLDGFTGIVVDRDGRPVADAVVRHRTDETTTDAFGRFRFADDARRSRIHAVHPVAGAGESASVVARPPRAGPVRVVLNPGSRLRGRVVGGRGGAIGDGRVSFGFHRRRRPWSARAAIGEDGTVVSEPFYTLRRRRMFVRVTARSHRPARVLVAVEPGRDADFGTVVLEPAPERSRLSGRVEGEAGVRYVVRVRGSLCNVDEDGSFDVRDLEPGPVRVLVGVPFSDARRGTFGPTIDLRPGEHVRGVVLRLADASFVRGVVFDHSGAPAAGVRVVAGRAWRGAVTDQAGRFRIEGLMPGRHPVAAVANGPGVAHSLDRWMEPVQVEVRPEGTEVVLRLPSPDVVRGRAVAHDGDALSADLRAPDGGVTPIRVGPDSTFEFERPRGRGHFVVFRARAHAPAWRQIYSRGARRILHLSRVELVSGRPVAGTVTLPDGAPASGARVRLSETNGGPVPLMETHCDGAGRFAFPHAPEPRLGLHVRHPDGRHHYETVPPADPADIAVRLPR